ncbi:MAG: glycosyltransferase [Crocinitomicaceae bacterium]|nr:glycosyltransferase [Crocinitomicaceae bacterium]
MEKPIRISVIIVNYNVEYFLEQCLNSVMKALENVSGEVYVVDNNSIDGSVEMVRAKFPNVHLIANRDNRGFSKANNQAMEMAHGDYFLLLNPDTVVEEDTFEKVVAFMDQNPDAGGLGVRMLDGKGKFLPESKRGLPTPAVAFYKIFGLSSIFPKSKLFGKYHLGYLSEFETNEVEILSGAFMLMRAKTIREVGMLDEAFFMYGEDIDLSYRIILGGYKNYYFPETRIIHYKGESTKKSSINYVFVFYRAMVIFAEKHFSQKNAKLFSVLINLAIYLRASLAIATRFIKKAALPVFDFIYILAGALLLTNHWQYVSIEFPANAMNVAIPAYVLVWMTSIFYAGGYDFPLKISKIFKGSIIGTLMILVIYGLLPKDWQFSRLYILVGMGWVLSYFTISRIFLHYSVGKRFSLSGVKNQNFLLVGSPEETDRVSLLLNQTNSKIDSVFLVSPTEEKNANQIGVISQLDQIAYIYQIDEIIFCAKDTTSQEIVNWMSILGSRNIDFKIAQPDSMYLIGSNSIETSGDLYVLNINQISKKKNIRNKRTLDILTSLTFLLISPVVIWFYEQKVRWFKNVFSCLFGKKTYVGYFDVTDQNRLLPSIKFGILNASSREDVSDSVLRSKLNLIYARDYTIWKDVEIILKSWKRLDC